ncbi:carboxymuconolactone decarboxylase family protein [Spirosoma flavum]|uniref:Carboxymuconolactone decarboxylase family protein n=1 Tax=Spirosoma flavum TaxID=2048557 RepID=A0ABW6APA8_9BACT
MPRITPLPANEATPDIQAAFDAHVTDYPGSRITNMKATLGRSLLAFQVYMQWYPLYEEVKKIVGDRLAYLFAHAISEGANCPLCTTFFRRIIIDNGERPEDLRLTDHEQAVIDFGSAIAQNKGEISDELYIAIGERYTDSQIVVLVAFAGQMIATNVFNNVLDVNIDEYLYPYLPLTQPKIYP